MGFRPEDLTPESEAFVHFFRLTFENYTFRMEPLPVFSDERLSSLTQPVIAVVGAQDAIFDSGEMRRRLESCVPNAQVHFLPGIGHGLTNQTTAVLEFLLQSR